MSKSEKQQKHDGGFLKSVPILGFLTHLMGTYDATFVVLLGFQYFNQGSGSMVDLANKDFYKHYLKLEPSQIAHMSSITGLPWSCKLLYGIMSDKMPFFGYKRKSYIILMGMVQFGSLFSLYFFEISDIKYLTICNFLRLLSGAFLDVIVDALMVVYSKQDEEEGSEELQSLSWGALGVGGMFSSIAGAYLTQYYHPKFIYLIYSIYGLIVMFLGINLSKDDDPSEEEAVVEKKTEGKSLSYHFKESLNQIIEAITMREIYMTLLFFVMSAVSDPQYGIYWYYFQMNVVQFSKFQYAMLSCLGYLSLVLGTIYYNKYLKDREVRTLIGYAIYLSIFAAGANLFWAKRMNLDFGISDSNFVIITDVVIGTLSLAYTQLPTLVLFAKITPSHIEATCFAFLTGTLNFCNGVISTYAGSLVNDMFVGVTSEDFSNFTTLAWISLLTSFFPLAFIWLIPLKSDIKKLQDGREKSDDKVEKSKVAADGEKKME